MAAPRRTRERHVMESVFPVIELLFLLLACAELCDAATVVDVYRLIQYDISGVPFGSRLAGLNHHAASLHFPPSSDLSRTVLIIPLRELNISFVKEYISQRQPLGGLLFLLPQMFNFENKDGVGSCHQDYASEQIKNVLEELEQLLLHSNIPYPVYFTFEDSDIEAVLADIKRNDATGQPATATTGGYKLVVSVPEPKKIASPTITNIQGWLPGLKTDGDNQLPTIAIVASYDTFGASPALSVGSDSNGSGAAALLEIARLFSILYSNPKTRGRYNLLFGLTSGGPYNYNGTHKWLRSFDQRLRESIDYAICLNSVGSWDNELWIHVSKPPENAYIKQIFEGFSNVGEELGVKVGLKHKKINISNPRVAWEHEQFSKLRVTAATISELSVAPELLERTGGLVDSRNFVNETAVIKSVKLIAESLARHVYGYQEKNIQIFADDSSLAVNPFYIKSWLELLSKTPRVAPFLSKNDPFILALKKELEDHTHEVNVQHEVLDGMFTFYDSSKAKLNIYQRYRLLGGIYSFKQWLSSALGTVLVCLFHFLCLLVLYQLYLRSHIHYHSLTKFLLHAYYVPHPIKVASVTFDLLLLLVLGSYLIVLFSFLVITTRGLDDLISLFRRPPSRKVKTA